MCLRAGLELACDHIRRFFVRVLRHDDELSQCFEDVHADGYSGIEMIVEAVYHSYHLDASLLYEPGTVDLDKRRELDLYLDVCLSFSFSLS